MPCISINGTPRWRARPGLTNEAVAATAPRCDQRPGSKHKLKRPATNIPTTYKQGSFHAVFQQCQTTCLTMQSQVARRWEASTSLNANKSRLSVHARIPKRSRNIDPKTPATQPSRQALRFRNPCRAAHLAAGHYVVQHARPRGLGCAAAGQPQALPLCPGHVAVDVHPISLRMSGFSE